MDEAWLVVLESLLLRRRVSFQGHQVVGGQQQRRARLDDDGLLRWRERGAQGLGATRAVFGTVAPLPLADGLPRDVVMTCQLGPRVTRIETAKQSHIYNI